MFILLSLSCVSAADDNQTMDDVALESDAVTDEILADTPGTFTELNDAIINSGNVLKLEKDYVFNSGGDASFKNEGIKITKDDFIIDGQGHTIDGANEAPIFEINSENVAFKNITFINANQRYSGGALEFRVYNWDYTYSIENCYFYNNTANYGAAVYLSGTGIIKNSVFINCNARVDAAVYININGIVDNCTFLNDTAGANCGGLKICGNSQVTNSNFTNCNADAYGGGCHLIGSHGMIKNCIFKDNSVTTLGGALYVARSNITDCAFYNSKSERTGGAIYGYNNNITNCIFINNLITGESSGGAISGRNAVRDSLFVNNSAYYGGAIYISDMGSAVINCQFINNSAHDGGAIFVSTGDAEIEYNTFINNSANNGGAINIRSNASLRYNDFFNNSAENGGALYAQDNSALSLYRDHFDGNLATSGTNIVQLSKNVTFSSKIDQDLGPFKGVLLKILNFTDSVYYGQTVNITVNVSCDDEALNDGIILVTLNNTNYTVNVVNGIAEIHLSELHIGDYAAELGYIYNSNYTKPKTNIQFSVNFAVLSIEVEDVGNIIYGEPSKIIAHVPQILENGMVYAIINNKTYSGEVVNGIGIVEIPKLDVGSYSASVFCTNFYLSTQIKEISFTIEKQNTTITAKNAAYVINYGGKYSVTVKGAAGEKVIFTLNGKNIGSAVTNAKGVATFSLTANILKAAKVGSKNLVIKLANDNYNCPAKTVKITINKEASKLAAKNKKFKKFKKTKKYAITLKNSKGKAVKKVQVTLKVKGKTYKAKTNTKGKAIFKIKKLTKKGKFKATIKFKGNAYYSSVTKKAKIIIK